MHPLLVKRVYLPADTADGARVLVDRLWPRGLSRERAALDIWLRDAAPSDELRHWFEHDPEKWEAFCTRYAAELDAAPDAWLPLLPLLRARPVTLLFGSREPRWNNAQALKAYLDDRLAARQHDAPTP